MSSRIWCWGRNEGGYLGIGDTENRSSPVVFGSYRSIACGNGANFAIDDQGMIWGWGVNNVGTLGNNEADLSYSGLADKSSPVSIARQGSYVAVAVGSQHALAIDHQGNLWSWGANNYGQLGVNNTDNRSSPVSVMHPGSYVAVAAGVDYSMAIDSSGMIWAWGYNTHGQLGVGDTNHRSSPVSILRVGSYSKIDAGNHLSMAIDASDGMAYTWGRNQFGQLGQNTIDNVSSPTAVVRTSSYTQVSVGTNGYSAMFLDADGSVLTCGFNDTGRLGVNDLDDRSSPTSIARPGSYVAIGAGFAHSLAIDSDGSVWGWGINTYGNLGDGTTESRSSPVSIISVSPSRFASVDAGFGYSYAVEYYEPPVPVDSYRDYEAQLLVQDFKMISGSSSLSTSKQQAYLDFTAVGNPPITSDLSVYDYSVDNGATWAPMTPTEDTVLTSITFTAQGASYRFKWEIETDLGRNFYNRHVRLRFRASAGDVRTAYAYVFIHFEKNTVDSSKVVRPPVFPKDYKGVSGSELRKNLPKLL